MPGTCTAQPMVAFIVEGKKQMIGPLPGMPRAILGQSQRNQQRWSAIKFKYLGPSPKPKTSGRTCGPILPMPSPKLGQRFHRLEEGTWGGIAKQKWSQAQKAPRALPEQPCRVAGSRGLWGAEPSLQLHEPSTEPAEMGLTRHPLLCLHRHTFLSSQSTDILLE